MCPIIMIHVPKVWEFIPEFWYNHKTSFNRNGQFNSQLSICLGCFWENSLLSATNMTAGSRQAFKRLLAFAIIAEATRTERFQLFLLAVTCCHPLVSFDMVFEERNHNRTPQRNESYSTDLLTADLQRYQNWKDSNTETNIADASATIAKANSLLKACLDPAAMFVADNREFAQKQPKQMLNW